MTAPTDRFVDIAHRNQEAVTTAVRTWAETVQNVATTMTSGRSQLADLQGVVAQYFDLAEKVLANQRELAQQWAAGAAKMSENVTSQVQHTTESVATRTADGTEAVGDGAAETTRAAAENAAWNPPAG